MAANGYPNSYQKGDTIAIPDASSESKVFHAGTKLEGGNILSNGGRVLCATSLGLNLEEAQEKAYNLVNMVNWDGCYYRTDIGFKGL